jgi:hypothetical protein
MAGAKSLRIYSFEEAGRWFDAAFSLLRVGRRQEVEMGRSDKTKFCNSVKWAPTVKMSECALKSLRDHVLLNCCRSHTFSATKPGATTSKQVSTNVLPMNQWSRTGTFAIEWKLKRQIYLTFSVKQVCSRRPRKGSRLHHLRLLAQSVTVPSIRRWASIARRNRHYCGRQPGRRRFRLASRRSARPPRGAQVGQRK